MKRLAVILLFLLPAMLAVAQTTKVRGQVVDASDGKAVPFAAVYFEGSKVGTTTDLDGNFIISTRDTTLRRLTASMLSYKSETVIIRAGVYSNTLFFLQPEKNQLDEAVVKADNSRAKRLLAAIDARKPFNNPELRPGYVCDVYSKMELDLTYPREQLRSKSINKHWNFIFDYIDTSDVSGVPYLPVAINESVSKRYHSTDPNADREEIIATRLSGAEPEGNLASQFTGSMHLKNNFYSSFVNVLNVEMPSPINSAGLLFYNYFIIDSLQVDGRKTLLVRYHPKPSISTPAFDGEMLIDAEDYALRRIKARLVKHQNINWVRDMLVEAEFQRQEDSTWFYKSNRFYADFSLVMADSAKVMSFIGNRTLEFSNPVFEKPEIDTGKQLVTVEEGAGMKSEEYWDQARPYALSDKERDIYGMVDRIQDTKLYNTFYDVVYTIINGYYDVGPVGFGPYLKLISYNPLEGFKLRLGMHTSVDWSKKDRLTGYIAYGFTDKEVKGGGSWEHLFSKEPTRKLTIDGHYDVLQLGRGQNKFNSDNILASLLGAGRTQKLLPVAEASALYDHEFNANINTSYLAMFREYYANSFVPMVTPGGTAVHSIVQGHAAARLRLSKDETVNRGHFIKKYVHSNYPIVSIALSGGVAALTPFAGDPSFGCFGYFQPEVDVDWTVRIAPVGTSKFHLNVGTIVGQVPYPMLHLHEGNGTFLLDKTSFSCMDFFEFASDTWATFMWDHNFQGFFLGKIPFIKRLQMREAITFKATWGYLTDKNNGSTAGSGAMMDFPQNMKAMGNVPYIEAGVALTNILRLFRIDCVWRCTHRDDVRDNARNFMVNFGIEFRF